MNYLNKLISVTTPLIICALNAGGYKSLGGTMSTERTTQVRCVRVFLCTVLVQYCTVYWHTLKTLFKVINVDKSLLWIFSATGNKS